VKTLIFVPAYEAEKTLEEVIRRIPHDVYEEVEEILIQDDASKDNTLQVALKLSKEYSKIAIVRNERNLGYGGTKKKAYSYCLQSHYDAVVMLHGDGQLPPECLPTMLAPLQSASADIVLGSRMLGQPICGGMPLYKWAGNRFLTVLANTILGLHLTDYHTGYRAYSAYALSKIQFDACGDGHEISMQLILHAVDQDLSIVEVPVPTYYGPESRSCSLRTSAIYGLSVVRMLYLWWIQKTKPYF